MGVVKIDDELHLIIEQNLKKLNFRVTYQTAKGFVDNAIRDLLIKEGLFKEERKRK